MLESQLRGLVTQHAISTTVVDFSGTGTANSTAYLIATYLGQGTLAGQTLVYYGKYEDEWVCDEAGEWRCRNRVLASFVSFRRKVFFFSFFFFLAPGIMVTDFGISRIPVSLEI